MDIIKKIAQTLAVSAWQVEKTVALMDEGATVPFIARYRKEMTGNLDDVQLRGLEKQLSYLRNLESRKEEVKKTIQEQEKLTEELALKIDACETLQQIEDLYAPFKKKKNTRAGVAKEKGLLPLGLYLYAQQDISGDIFSEAQKYQDEDKGVATIEDALQGAKDIVAEMISEDIDLKEALRKSIQKEGVLQSEVKEAGTDSVYEMYYDYKEPVQSVPSHRILAINRGEKEDILKVKIQWDDEAALSGLIFKTVKNMAFSGLSFLHEAIEDGYKRLLKPALVREFRNALTEMAEERAISVFADNTKPLLLQAPVRDKVLMGLDPGFRTGCKLAVIDETGKYLAHDTIYPTEPRNDVAGAKKKMLFHIQKYGVHLIVIGNGTASRETEMVVSEMIRESGLKIFYTIASEAGASVYSASEIANAEFPNLDVSIRGAISIARRVQDPLAELVKIEPKAIGVGQYQHDVNQKNLGDTLTQVVSDCVNRVGVDLNTASYALLSYVSGLSESVAKEIVKYRDENGSFKDRKELLKVKRLGQKTFEQCAGFLRIPAASNFLDKTAVHPESYAAAKALLEKLSIGEGEMKKGGTQQIEEKLKAYGEARENMASTSISDLKSLGRALGQKGPYQRGAAIEKLAKEMAIGVYTLSDIIEELKKPGRDPREEMPKPLFKQDILKMEDLKEGMILTGTVRNVIDFGAFIDIGLKQDGLVHISEISKKFIRHPSQVLSVGDEVRVCIKEVDLKKGRIALSMKGLGL